MFSVFSLPAAAARFKLFLYTEDNPSTPQSCTANILFILITFTTAGYEQRRRRRMREDGKTGVCPSYSLHAAKRHPLCVCLHVCVYTTKSLIGASSIQNEKSQATEGVPLFVQADIKRIAASTFMKRSSFTSVTVVMHSEITHPLN